MNQDILFGIQWHESKADPHPGYLTAAEGAALFQPLDTELTALAGLTSAADRLPYFTGVGTAALADLTAAARTVLDDLTVADMVNTLFANQGTTTTVLHGNAAGNPSWAQISLTADVTGDLPYANLAQGSALSVLGVAGNATADVASIAAASDHQVLRRSGLTIGFGAIDLSQAAATTNQLPLAAGGTAANLTASNGGIVYSGAGALAILSGTATAGQILRSGASAAPSWSTATYPASTAAVGRVLRSDGTNFLDAALAASDLSNGTTGSGAVVLAASPSFSGAPTTDGAYATTLTNGSVFDAVSATTGYLHFSLKNTSGWFYVGLNGSTGASFMTGGTAYAGVLNTNVDKPIDVGINSVRVASFSSSAVDFDQIVKTPASTTTQAGLRIPSGTAPSSPTSGDMWYDGTNLKFRDGGTTRTVTWT